MIKGIGLDILDVSRMAKVITQTHFVLRVFTERERAYAFACSNTEETLAGIYCAKEAVVKALGTGFTGMRFHDIEVLHDEYGKPYIELHEAAYDRMRILRGISIFLSISHTKSLSIAQVIIE